MKTTYFVLNAVEFGRASFKGNDAMTVKWRDEFFRTPKWRVVSQTRYILHPLFQKTLYRRYWLSQKITGWMATWGYVKFWGNLFGWLPNDDNEPYPRFDPGAGLYKALCRFEFEVPQEIADRYFRSLTSAA